MGEVVPKRRPGTPVVLDFLHLLSWGADVGAVVFGKVYRYVCFPVSVERNIFFI